MRVYWEAYGLWSKRRWTESGNTHICNRRRFDTVREAAQALRIAGGADKYRLVREDGVVLLTVSNW